MRSKKLIYFLFSIILTILLGFISTRYFISTSFLDLRFDNLSQCTNDKRHKVWLVSYANDSVYLANQNWQTFSAINKCIDFYLPYNQNDLDPDFVEKNKFLLSQKRGAGYWVWKPYIILKALQMIPENDIIIYLDTGIFIEKPIDSLLNNSLKHADIALLNIELLNKFWVKRDILREFDFDNDEIRNSPNIAAGYILIRNTHFSRKFILEWLSYSQKSHLIDDSPSKDEYLDFKDNRHDQALLTMLYYKNLKTIESRKIILIESAVYDEYFLNTRRKKIKKSYLRYLK